MESPDFLTLFESIPSGRRRLVGLSKASGEKAATWNVLVRLGARWPCVLPRIAAFTRGGSDCERGHRRPLGSPCLLFAWGLWIPVIVGVAVSGRQGLVLGYTEGYPCDPQDEQPRGCGLPANTQNPSAPNAPGGPRRKECTLAPCFTANNRWDSCR